MLRCLYPWLAYLECDTVIAVTAAARVAAEEGTGECAVDELCEDAKLMLPLLLLLPQLLPLEALLVESRLLKLLLVEQADAVRLEATRANSAVRFCCRSTSRDGSANEEEEDESS